MYSTRTLALAIAPLLLAVSANVDFDLDDVPNSCKAICRPVAQLSSQCDVDLRSDNDRDENLLQAQCVCTNTSFDVGKIAGLCADCMHQSANSQNRDDDRADRDDLRDIDNLMSTCEFSSTKYSPDATGQLQGVSVSASRPTDVNQLTTTMGQRGPAGSTPTGSTGAVTTTDSTGGLTTMSPSTTAGGQTGTQTSVATSTTSNPAAPAHGRVATDALFVVGALMAGGMMLQ